MPSRRRHFSPASAAIIPLALLIAATGLRAAEEKITFNDHVQNALSNACAGCHNADKKKGGLDLTSASAVLAGGSGGAVAEPGDPGGSRLLKIIRQEIEPKMPPDGPPLDAAAAALVEKWIAGGMPESKDSKAVAKKSGPDLGFTAKAGKPEGPPATPEWLPIEPIRTVPRQGPVLALAASPWAPLLAVGGERQIQFVHLDNGLPLGVLDFPEGGPYVLRFSSDGRWLMAGGGIGAKSGRIVVFDVTTGRRRMELGRESDAVLAADIRPDLSQVALGGSARKVKLYQPGHDEATDEIKKHTDWLTACAYSPDGRLFATGDRGGGVQVWESEARAELHSLRGHEKAITATAWRPDGKLLATASEDGTVRLWDMNSGKQIKSFPAHGGGVLDLSWSQDGRLVSCGRDRKTKVWKSDGSLIKEWTAGDDAITRAVFSHDGQFIATGDFTGKVVIWTINGKRRHEFAPNPPTVAERIAQDRQRLTEAKAELAKAEETLRAALAARQPIIAKHDAGTAGVAKLEKSIAAAKKSRGEKSIALDKLKEQIMVAESEIESWDSDQKRARAHLDSLNKKITALTKEQNDLRARLLNLNKERDSARQTRDKAIAAREAGPGKPELIEAARLADEALAKAEETLKESTNRAATLQSEIDALHGDLAGYRRAHDREVAALDKRREETKVLRQNLEKLGNAINELAMSITAAENEMKQARAGIEEAKKAMAAHDKSIAEATAARDEVAARVASIESRLRLWQAEPMRLEIRSARKRLWDGEAAVAEAKAMVDEAAALVEKQTLRRNAARETVLKGQPMAEAKLLLAQSRLDHARRHLATRAATADRLENELQSRKVQVERLKARFAGP